MNNHEDNSKDFIDQRSFIRTFSSQEEAELYNLKQDIDRSDMAKFHLFCRMRRISKMLSSARKIKENNRAETVDKKIAVNEPRKQSLMA